MNKKTTDILRVNNERIFIERYIELSVDTLDELIIVYIDYVSNKVLRKW